jgi:hypothetical protein
MHFVIPKTYEAIVPDWLPDDYKNIPPAALVQTGQTTVLV